MRKAVMVWAALAVALITPLAFAATSPLLAWRDPIYIAASLAGVVALALMLLQPVLAAGLLPSLGTYARRRLHRMVGIGLVLAVLVHVAGLWITSPPDMIDALLFVSPTPFSAWGVIAMWALFATALLAATRRRLRLRWRAWRMAHGAMGLLIALGTAVHAVLIEGTMEQTSKVILCGLVLLTTLYALVSLGVFANRSAAK